MRKAFSILALAALAQLHVSAQEEKKEKANEWVKPSRDFVMIQLHHDGWNVADGGNVKTSGIGRGFSAYLMYDFPLGNNPEKTHFSFAAGAGVSANNIYFKGQLPNLRATDVLTFIDTDPSWKKNKYTTAFIEMPLELRFFGNSTNRNKGFKMAIGAKVGILLDSHVKYSEPISGTYLNHKIHARKFNEAWRLAPMVRIGWGNFSVFAQYNVSTLYKMNSGPKIFPYSVGLTITGL